MSSTPDHLLSVNILCGCSSSLIALIIFITSANKGSKALPMLLAAVALALVAFATFKLSG